APAVVHEPGSWANMVRGTPGLVARGGVCERGKGERQQHDGRETNGVRGHRSSLGAGAGSATIHEQSSVPWQSLRRPGGSRLSTRGPATPIVDANRAVRARPPAPRPREETSVRPDRRLAVLALLALPTSARAASVTGTFFDKSSQSPLFGVEVVVR